MAWWVRVFLVLLAAALAAPFFLARPDGLPWLDASELSPDIQVNDSYDRAKLAVYRHWYNLRRQWFDDPKAGKTKAYRWQDEAGNWHLSDSPNPAGAAEEIWVDPNANIVQAVPIRNPAGEEKNATQVDTKTVPLPMTVSPRQVERLMHDAQQVQQLMDARAQELEAQLQK